MNILLSLLNSTVLMLVLAIIFLLLNVLDGHSTWLVIRPHHYYREKNPIARWVFRRLGVPHGIVLFKAGLLSILILAGSFYGAWETFTLNIVLIVADLLFTYVVVHNYRLYRTLRRWQL